MIAWQLTIVAGPCASSTRPIRTSPKRTMARWNAWIWTRRSGSFATENISRPRRTDKAFALLALHGPLNGQRCHCLYAPSRRPPPWAKTRRSGRRSLQHRREVAASGRRQPGETPAPPAYCRDGRRARRRAGAAAPADATIWRTCMGTTACGRRSSRSGSPVGSRRSRTN